jgi:multisubunit Na+/H+ antiporter MnhF subunit
MSSYCVWLLSLTSSTSIYRVLSGPMPFVRVFQDAFVDTKSTLAFTGVVLSLVIVVAVSSLAATSRLVYAFG